MKRSGCLFPLSSIALTGRLLPAVCALALATPAHAVCDDPSTFFGGICKTLADTWNEGKDDLMVPFHTHHLRYAYSRERISRLVENTWGLGYGRTRYDSRGNSDSLYAMGFRDSHGDFEPIIGYAHRWNVGDVDAVHAGLGYTVFITARSDTAHYLPIPGILPVASLNYRRNGINMTYVPGGKAHGNILFFWANIGL